MWNTELLFQALGEQKIASMVECKNFHKGIIQQEWEHKRMSMQIEDLKNKARDIQMLHVSQELQEVKPECAYGDGMLQNYVLCGHSWMESQGQGTALVIYL